MRINESIGNFLHDRIRKVLDDILENEKDRIFHLIETRIKADVFDAGIDFIEILKNELHGHHDLFLKVIIDDRRKDASV